MDDSIVEPCEEFYVHISSSSDRAIIEGDSSVAVQISDDEGECVLTYYSNYHLVHYSSLCIFSGLLVTVAQCHVARGACVP